MDSRYLVGVKPVLLLLMGLLLAETSSADMPKKINYQGRIANSTTGKPLSGSHEMVFRFYEVESDGVSLWAESHTVVADSGGIVSVILGADDPIDIAFGAALWLEVEVDGEVLTPRREITSVPYAFYAGEAGRASNADSLGGMDSDGFADTAHVHDDRYYTESELNTTGTVNDSGNPVDWTRLKGVPADFADGTDNTGAGDSHSLDAVDGSPSDVVYVAADGKVGIGTTIPAKKLHVNGDLQLNHNQALSFGDDNTRVYQSGADLYARAADDIHIRPTDQLYIGTGTSNHFAFDTGQRRLGIGTTTPAEALDVVGRAKICAPDGSPLTLTSTGQAYIDFETTGAGPVGLKLENTHRPIYLLNGAGDQDRFDLLDGPSGKSIVSVDGPTGNVGIWTTDPEPGAVVTVDAEGRSIGLIAYGSSAYGIVAEYDGSTSGAAVSAQNYGDNDASAVKAYANAGKAAVQALAESGADYALYAEGGDTTYAGYFDGYVAITDNLTGSTRAFAVYDEPSTVAWQSVNIEATPSSPMSDHDMLQILTPAAAPGDFQFIECQRGTDWEFRVHGDGDVTAAGTITGGGADMAEMIAVAGGAVTVEPGDVLVVDPAGTRSVTKSTSARSTFVAGIHSAKPGFVGSEREWDRAARPGVEEGGGYTLLDMATEFDEIPMAVVGIVPCKVSAENGPIRPGDLLVTSSTPGHAMRDGEPGVGTVLGKALESLDTGTGLIRVLVALQ